MSNRDQKRFLENFTRPDSFAETAYCGHRIWRRPHIVETATEIRSSPWTQDLFNTARFSAKLSVCLIDRMYKCALLMMERQVARTRDETVRNRKRFCVSIATTARIPTPGSKPELPSVTDSTGEQSTTVRTNRQITVYVRETHRRGGQTKEEVVPRDIALMPKELRS